MGTRSYIPNSIYLNSQTNVWLIAYRQAESPLYSSCGYCRRMAQMGSTFQLADALQGDDSMPSCHIRLDDGQRPVVLVVEVEASKAVHLASGGSPHPLWWAGSGNITLWWDGSGQPASRPSIILLVGAKTHPPLTVSRTCGWSGPRPSGKCPFPPWNKMDRWPCTRLPGPCRQVPAESMAKATGLPEVSCWGGGWAQNWKINRLRTLPLEWWPIHLSVVSWTSCPEHHVLLDRQTSLNQMTPMKPYNAPVWPCRGVVMIKSLKMSRKIFTSATYGLIN